MHISNLIDLAATIADRLCGAHEYICVALLRHLATGRPVSLAALAQHLEMDRPAIEARVRQIPDVDYDAAGNVIGFGLSLTPTAHQFTINSQILYTWCALDTFFYTALLDQPATVASTCLVSGHPIVIAMGPEGILELSPASTVISIAIPNRSIADCRRSAFCNHGHFFATAEAATAWQRDHPDGVILPATDAHRLGRLLADRRLLLAHQQRAAPAKLHEHRPC